MGLLAIEVDPLDRRRAAINWGQRPALKTISFFSIDPGRVAAAWAVLDTRTAEQNSPAPLIGEAHKGVEAFVGEGAGQCERGVSCQTV
ncbi:MAG: hypothetical protein DI534_10630 [Leifsonia xyli]|nr:MAG: hypothetical protein DI534_10630 [Leifsonia xyli]